MLRRMPDNLPKHVGVMLDGNRRWARSVGRESAHGHQAGADNNEPLLGWCDEVGIEVVTLWLLSTDNLNRPPAELTQRWEGYAWPSARGNSHILAALPPGSFPGVDEADVYTFLERHALS